MAIPLRDANLHFIPHCWDPHWGSSSLFVPQSLLRNLHLYAFCLLFLHMVSTQLILFWPELLWNNFQLCIWVIQACLAKEVAFCSDPRSGLGLGETLEFQFEAHPGLFWIRMRPWCTLSQLLYWDACHSGSQIQKTDPFQFRYLLGTKTRGVGADPRVCLSTKFWFIPS